MYRQILRQREHFQPYCFPMPKNAPETEVAISHDLIHTLLAEFVPELAHEPLELVASGWDNEIHRVGTNHAVRLPRREASSGLVVNEQRWLPELEELLPVAIPTPTYSGKPAFGFPWNWSVVPWLPGVPLAHAPTFAPAALIEDLAQFQNALHVPAVSDAPRNPFRGVPLVDRTAAFTKTKIELEPSVQAAVTELWDELVDTPPWGGEPVWIHGDLHPLNILVRAGRINAVLDFGDVSAGDPATDISIAWMVFDQADREALRNKLTIDGKGIDIHTWNRARAWALLLGTTFVANSADDPTLRRIGEETLSRVLT